MEEIALLEPKKIDKENNENKNIREDNTINNINNKPNLENEAIEANKNNDINKDSKLILKNIRKKSKSRKKYTPYPKHYRKYNFRKR